MSSTQHRDKLRIKEFGLSEVSTSPNPSVDVVFVHGLNGSAYDTWTTKKSDVFWPADLLPHTLARQELRILVYGYDANVSAFMDGTSQDKIHNHAEHLAAHLFANRNLNGAVERPIIFICHSLGGLIVKKCLTHCSRVRHEKIQHLRSIYVSTYGILFLGTPHNGSDVAKLGGLLQSICSYVLPKKFFDTSPQLINSLKTDNEHLQIINRDFIQIIDRFRIYFFHESKPMDLKTTRAFIVDESSAAPLIDGVERMGIEADHGGMCRFEDENSPGYEAVAEAIFRYSTDSHSVIPTRWVQERRDRATEVQQEAMRLQGLLDPLAGSVSSLPTDKLDSAGSSAVSLPPKPASDAGDIPRSQDPVRDRCIRVVPPGFHPNASFFGMEKELTELHTRLYKAKKRAAGSAAVLLHGPPGSGKSHLARQYMYTHQTLYSGGIFWIDCRTKESRYNGIWQIAQIADELTGDKESQDLGWGSTDIYVDRVRKWLNSRQEWLLIFDGISFEHSHDIDEFRPVVPSTPNTAIIYTSVDRSLSRKSRLMEPYGLEVKRLGVSDACKLLFKNLGVKHPTHEEEKKAVALVKYYQCLPLAIYATGHRLRATGKALEKYHFDSHLTDEKLAGPYRDIMKDLRLYEHFEALNLIKILSFYGHHVPVGLLILGRKALNAYSVEIRTADRGGSNQRHLDNTFGTLMRYGLVERTLYLYSLNDLGDSGTLSFSQLSSDLEDSHASDNDTVSTASRSSIETVKIHTVVQGFFRDELKDEGDNHYYWWLGLAAALFCVSYNDAKTQMRATRGSGLARDYREYLIHAKKLLSHFPVKLTKVAMSLQDLHETLKALTEEIQSEIENRAPGSDQDVFPNQKSIFDRTTSMSSAPDTPNSQISEPDWDGIQRPLMTDSPINIYFPHQLVPSMTDPNHHIPIVSDERNTLTDVEAESYTTDLTRAHSRSTEVPQSSPVPQVIINEGEDSGWQTVERKPRRNLLTTFGQLRRVKGKKNLANFSPRPTVSVSEVHAEVGSRKSNPSFRVPGEKSGAESALAAVNRRPNNQKENRPSYAYVLSNQSDTSLSRKSAPTLSNRQSPLIPNSQAVPQGDQGDGMPFGLNIDHPIDPMSLSTYSDPGMPTRHSPKLPTHRQSASSGPHSPASLRSSHSGGPHQLSRELFEPPKIFGQNQQPLPYQADVAISHRPQRTTLSHIPGVRAPPSHVASSIPVGRSVFPVEHMPTGYSSQPMSREHSAQSGHSLRTEPTRFPPNFSPNPMAPSPAFGDRVQLPMLDTRRGQRLVFGVGGSAANSTSTSPVSFEAPMMSRGSSGPGWMVNSEDGKSRSVVEFSRIPNRQHIQFGSYHPVDIDAARRRARQPTPYPQHNLIPSTSDEAQRELMASHQSRGGSGDNLSSHWQRPRSGSSPAPRHDLRGFGVQFQ